MKPSLYYYKALLPATPMMVDRQVRCGISAKILRSFCPVRHGYIEELFFFDK